MKVLTGCRVHTMDSRHANATALAYDRGRIVAVGATVDVLAQAGPTAEVIDLPGTAVIPGFVDAHNHLSYGLLFDSGVACHPDVVTSVGDILAALQRHAQGIPAGGWVVGVGYNEGLLAERRHPTRQELDDACPRHPVYLLHFSHHQAAANSLALELAGINRHSINPQGGFVARGRDGRLTGQLIGTAVAPVEALARGDMAFREQDNLTARIQTYQQRLFHVGITRILDPVVPPDLRALYDCARESGALRIPCVICPVAPGAQIHSPQSWLNHGSMGEGDDQLRIGPAKFILDGANRCNMCVSFAEAITVAAQAALRTVRHGSLDQLRTLQGGSLRRTGKRRFCMGTQYLPDDRALELAQESVARGFSLMMHAIGDNAVHQALDLVEACRTNQPDAIPPRIEHAVILRTATIRRAADLGVIVSSQPGFLSLASRRKLAPLPPSVRMIPQRSLLDAGVTLVNSSDYPAADLDPLNNLRLAVQRHCPGGHVVHGEESLEPIEALRSYTLDAARACGCADQVGSISPGKRADLVFLSDDPCRPGVDLDALHVKRTLLAGETVYDARSDN